MNKKFKIGSIFENEIRYGCIQVTEDTETYGGCGCGGYYITKEDISHLLNGGILNVDDGEYEHYIKLAPECNHDP